MGRPSLSSDLAEVNGAKTMSPARFKDRELDAADDRLLDDDLNPLLYECAEPLLFDGFERECWRDFVRRSFWLRASEYHMAMMATKLIAKLMTNTLYDKDWTALTNLLVKLGCCPTSRGQIMMKKKSEMKKTGKFY